MGLHGKLANICGETGVEGINDLSNLKAATGRDQIEARQPHKQWVKFYNYAKMVFSMNQVPTINDSTRGRIRRMKTIDYRNSFVRGVNADENLEDKLMQPESLTGILNWAIEGLQRLIKVGDFTDTRTEAEIAIEFERKSNPVRHFVQEHIDDVTAEFWENQIQANAAFHFSKVTFGQIIETYVAYAEKNNLPTLNPKYIIATVKYECERAGYMLKQCRERYTIDSKTKKALPRQDYFKGIVICGREELGLPEIPAKKVHLNEEKTETKKSNETIQKSIDGTATTTA
jgi:putative DNA primase/helicase